MTMPTSAMSSPGPSASSFSGFTISHASSIPERAGAEAQHSDDASALGRAEHEPGQPVDGFDRDGDAVPEGVQEVRGHVIPAAERPDRCVHASAAVDDEFGIRPQEAMDARPPAEDGGDEFARDAVVASGGGGIRPP